MVTSCQKKLFFEKTSERKIFLYFFYVGFWTNGTSKVSFFSHKYFKDYAITQKVYYKNSKSIQFPNFYFLFNESTYRRENVHNLINSHSSRRLYTFTPYPLGIFSYVKFHDRCILGTQKRTITATFRPPGQCDPYVNSPLSLLRYVSSIMH